MTKPVLLAVDDDAEVLRAVQRDLRGAFADRLRIVGAGSGAAALEVVRQLKERNEALALMLVDQKMPGMTGVEFVEQALDHFPTAKKVLLTAYADTDAAIRAINGARIDYYLLKPWDPPEEKLFPVVEDLLCDWFADYTPPFEGIRVYGHRYSPESHAVKNFLARNQIPYQWFDVEAQKDDPEVRKVIESAPGKFPLVTLPDNGPCLEMPTPAQLGERLGLKTHVERPFYDLAIVGAGPAGLAAAVYGASEGLQTVVVEREAPGGQAGSSSLIENYLGFPTGLSGADLARRARDQAIRFGVEMLTPSEATKLEARDGYRVLHLADGQEIVAHAVILAMGVSYKRLNVAGEENLFGKGVYYGAALTEAINCRDEEVCIVGGANSAGQAAMHFARYAGKVTMLVRGDSLDKAMSQYLVDRIGKTPNIEVRLKSQVKEMIGNGRLEKVRIEGPKGEDVISVSSIFIFIGAEPLTDWLDGTIVRDQRGFIPTGPELLEIPEGKERWTEKRPPSLLETSMPGVFAAGDVRSGSVKRVASSVGQGSIAVQIVHEYLREVRA
ncbi:FAD-dependent oxidoreductase [Fimbriimonas ginsengisoli]|uniref:Thioredoxin reductase n=1 Tax=Fimbriimonas ginsengisoli Gsoil 348 TaxID=661478 RepID=A0A068NSA8_FIMGI|nr:FAD-dependent oxidoreductase [Fimbriimonas ginsengisoli]AIE84489.1 thioredoxin reductase [Fimbriimonas ginsengisoli Gsoil 348]